MAVLDAVFEHIIMESRFGIW